MKHHKSLTLLAVAALLAMTASVPFILYGAAGAIGSMFNAPIRWIPASFPALREFHAFTDQFDVHETILISWPGCTVDDPRLHNFADELERLRSQQRRQGEPELIVAAPNGYDLLRDLMTSQSEIPRASALARLRRVLVGPDLETSCAAIELTTAGAKNRETALAMVLAAADAAVGLPRDQYRLAGPPIDGIAIDQLSIESLESFALPSAILSLLLCWICLRSLWFTLPLVAVAAIGQGVVVAAVYYTGASMNAVLILLPPLVFVLAISAGVHLVHYFYEERRNRNTQDPTMAALRKGWLPTTLAAATTAIGLGSLLVSDVGPVRQFGVLGPLGVLLSSLLVLIVLPGAMQWWPRHQALPHQSTAAETVTTSKRQGIWERLAGWVSRANRLIIFASLLALGFFGYGLTYVTTTLNVVSLLDEETKTVEDYRWFQEHIGPLITVEVVVPFDDSVPLELLERAELIWRVHGTLLQIDQVEGAISAATFLPPIPQGGGVSGIVRRTAYEKRLESQLETLREAGYVRQDGDRQRWRVSGRVQGSRDVDYGRFLDQLRSEIDPVVDEATGEETVEVSYTGVTPVVYEVQRALLADLFNSFLMAIGLVGCLMILILRSVSAGLVAMIPNVFPTVILFGSMGWLGWSIDIGSVMTASVALGIAVDGTLHFLASFSRQRRAGKDALTATSETYRHCGRALVQTALICAAGMLIFTNSRFLPARSFSWMLLLLLLIAAIGDLIVLPALLVGPPGRLFNKSRNTRWFHR